MNKKQLLKQIDSIDDIEKLNSIREKYKSERFPYSINKQIYKRIYGIKNRIAPLEHLVILNLKTGNIDEMGKYTEKGLTKSPNNPIFLFCNSILYAIGYYGNIDIHKAKKCLENAEKSNLIRFINDEKLLVYCREIITISDLESNSTEKEDAAKKLSKLSLKKNEELEDSKNLLLFFYFSETQKLEEAYKIFLFYKEKQHYFSAFFNSLLCFNKEQYEESKMILSNFVNDLKMFNDKNINNSRQYMILVSYSYCFLGLSYLNLNDNKNARFYLTKAIENNNTDASYYLGMLFYEEKKYTHALDAFKKGFENLSMPDVRCIDFYAYILQHFFPNKKNLIEATKYYKIALEKGYYHSAKNLGELYLNGNRPFYALQMFRLSIDKKADNFDESQTLIDEYYAKKNTMKSFIFLSDYSNDNSNSDELYGKIKKWIREKINSGVIEINDQIIDEFSIGIFNCISLNKTETNLDLSSSIVSLHKGVEFLVKKYLIEPFVEWMKDNNHLDELEHMNIIDYKIKSEIYFSLGDFRTIIDDKNKKLFFEFADNVLRISNNYKKEYFKMLNNGFLKLCDIRNSATHNNVVTINEVAEYLNILFFENNLIIKFVGKLK